ncbi:hypothetical protein VOI54_17055 [Tamlana sp. 2201CG12-4]|uniref:hypothetical protein n=1 Tax=Tamlana sp. 2201CG12-4 TaxID=3112582 RepID=UPI002DBFF18A|nr:hypothetical protein [Tamlana sp. 2201CG12-4]MEC3908739.1 hypothetical protein [Tamlana sp. 2201CG12-4]
MNKKYFTVILLLLFGSIFIGVGQNSDKIYLKNKEVINCKILRVTEKHVEIDPEGSKPFLMIDRTEINIIIYQDNTIVSFNEEDNNRTNKVNKASISNKSILTVDSKSLRPHGIRSDGIYIAREPFKLDKQGKSLVGAFTGAHAWWPIFAIKSEGSSRDRIYFAFITMKYNQYKKIQRQNLSSTSFENLRNSILSDQKIRSALLSSKHDNYKYDYYYVHDNGVPYLFVSTGSYFWILGELKALEDGLVTSNIYWVSDTPSLIKLTATALLIDSDIKGASSKKAITNLLTKESTKNEIEARRYSIPFEFIPVKVN